MKIEIKWEGTEEDLDDVLNEFPYDLRVVNIDEASIRDSYIWVTIESNLRDNEVLDLIDLMDEFAIVHNWYYV